MSTAASNQPSLHLPFLITRHLKAPRQLVWDEYALATTTRTEQDDGTLFTLERQPRRAGRLSGAAANALICRACN
jgi:hypothetical protein